MKNVKPEFPVENSQKRLGTPLPKNRQARFPLSEYIFQGTIRKEIARSM